MSAIARELTPREQEIHDNLVENTELFGMDLGKTALYSNWSRQVRALAKAVAIELAGLEKKVSRD